MIGVDLAKNVFQLHGASMTGQPQFRKKLSRQSFFKFVAELVTYGLRDGGVWRRALPGT
jgi:transposase